MAKVYVHLHPIELEVPELVLDGAKIKLPLAMDEIANMVAKQVTGSDVEAVIKS